MSTPGVPMFSGVEEASYAANSGPQSSVLLRCRSIIERAIAMQKAIFLEMKEQQQQQKETTKRAAGSLKGESHAAEDAAVDIYGKVFRIADMGCSSGPNCLANMQFILETIKKYELSSRSASSDLQYFFCDLPSNDFNKLLQLHHAQFAVDGRCFGAAVGGSVYGRLFPSSCLHLVFSSFCLHWLSQTPQSVTIPNTKEWNKGKIWVDGPLANEATGRAYAHQWQQDMNVFLKCRNKEMVKGGLMILLILCRDDSFPPHQMQVDSCFGNLELSWKELIQEGVLEQSELDSFNIPIYLPTIQELMTATSSVPNFKIQSLEVIEEAIGDNYWKQWSHDPDDWATRMNNFYKSLFWNVIDGHVGTTKCKAIFHRFKELLKTSLQNQQCNWDSYWVYPWPSHAILQVFKDV